MKTLGELVTQTRDLLDEATARQWSDPQIRRWIMDGARDAARRTECLQERFSTPASAAVQEYELPQDIVRAHRVEYVETSSTQTHTLEYRDWHTMDEVWWLSQTSTQQTPQMWTMWGFPPQLKLVLYPTPAVAGTLTVFYYKLPLDLLDDATQDTFDVELPEGWHDLCVEWAVCQAQRRDADPRWQEARGIYEDHLADLYTTAIRWTDQAGMIASGSGSSYPAWLVNEDY